MKALLLDVLDFLGRLFVKKQKMVGWSLTAMELPKVGLACRLSPCMYMCMAPCVAYLRLAGLVCFYVCVYVHGSMCVYVHGSMCVYMCMAPCVYMCMAPCVCICAWLHVCVYVHGSMCGIPEVGWACRLWLCSPQTPCSVCWVMHLTSPVTLHTVNSQMTQNIALKP